MSPAGYWEVTEEEGGWLPILRVPTWIRDGPREPGPWTPLRCSPSASGPKGLWSQRGRNNFCPGLRRELPRRACWVQAGGLGVPAPGSPPPTLWPCSPAPPRTLPPLLPPPWSPLGPARACSVRGPQYMWTNARVHT